MPNTFCRPCCWSAQGRQGDTRCAPLLQPKLKWAELCARPGKGQCPPNAGDADNATAQARGKERTCHECVFAQHCPCTAQAERHVPQKGLSSAGAHSKKTREHDTHTCWGASAVSWESCCGLPQAAPPAGQNNTLASGSGDNTHINSPANRIATATLARRQHRLHVLRHPVHPAN